MKAVVVPTTDVNSDTARLVSWHAASGTSVARGQLLATIETSKAALDIDAREPGILVTSVEAGTDFPLAEPIAYLCDSSAEVEEVRRRQLAEAEARNAGAGDGAMATKKAAELARREGIDLDSLKTGRLITVKDVEGEVARRTASAVTELLEPLPAELGLDRLLLIGGGRGATQVMSILRDEEAAAGRKQRMVVAILDDTPGKTGEYVEGVPVIGATRELRQIAERGLVDGVIVAISSSVAARARFRSACGEVGLPLAENVIHPSAVIADDVRMGRGNVVCALCHFGNTTVIGDNNFFSAYNSFDHHNQIGSDNSTGPACVVSGSVTIGDRVRLGTGIFVEPLITVGTDVQVASGAILVASIEAGHAVKTKVVTTTVVPIRG